jgi:hypothetical protein
VNDKRESYIKLPGRGRKAFLPWPNGYQRLWLGADHVLVVDSGPLSERSRRFAFADIQSLETCRTSAGRGMNLLWGLLVALTVLLGLGLPGFNRFWYFMAFIFAVALVLNIVFGPTCRSYLRTAVHEERLTALGRYRTAVAVMETLSTQIQSAQGVLVVDAGDEAPVLRTDVAPVSHETLPETGVDKSE